MTQKEAAVENLPVLWGLFKRGVPEPSRMSPRSRLTPIYTIFGLGVRHTGFLAGLLRLLVTVNNCMKRRFGGGGVVKRAFSTRRIRSRVYAHVYVSTSCGALPYLPHIVVPPPDKVTFTLAQSAPKIGIHLRNLLQLIGF